MLKTLSVSPFFWPTVRLLPLETTADVTDYEFLCSVVKKMSELIQSNNDLADISEQLVADVAELQKQIDQIKNGDYEWLRDIITKAIKNVFFGLTPDGRFCAYVPQSWSDIEFRTTGYDIDVPCAPDYGHLVLRY